MSSTSIIVNDLTLLTVWEALSTLSEEGVANDATISVSQTPGGMYRISAKNPAPHKGVKQRCATVDANGRRCIRGPRHRENHRYEED